MASFYLQLIIEGTLPNVRHRLGDSDASQRAAIVKYSVSNCCHRLRDNDAFQRTATCKAMVPNGCHRLRDSDAHQRTALSEGTVPNGRHRLRDCHLDHLIVAFQGSERGRDVDSEEALHVDAPSCCAFNFVSGVNDSHFGFGIQQPCRLQCLSIVYEQSVRQDLYVDVEDFVLNGIFTLLSFMKHCLQFLNGVCLQDFNSEDTTFLRSSLKLRRAWQPWRRENQQEIFEGGRGRMPAKAVIFHHSAIPCMD